MCSEFDKAVARVTVAAERFAQTTGLCLQPDPTLRRHVIAGLAENLLKHGRMYCPCREVTGDSQTDRINICPCRAHRDEIERLGECECGLYTAERCGQEDSSQEGRE